METIKKIAPKPSRLKFGGIILVESLICSSLATLLCWAVGLSISQLGPVWLELYLGPFVMRPYSSLLELVIIVTINILSIAGYFIRPNAFTLMVSFLGVAVWFFCGMLGMVSGV